MLTEIEERLVQILQEHVEGVPKDNIVLDAKPAKLPAVTISNLGFKLEKLGLAEDVDQSRVELEERFPTDGVQTNYKLREKPLKGSLRVECPPGVPLTENVDYAVDVDGGSISFPIAPPKGRKRILVKYSSQRALTVKGLKVRAKYRIEAWGTGRAETDSIAEGVVKALLAVDEELALEGINVKPLGGRTIIEQGEEKARRIRLVYLFERELRVEKPVPTIERIEIAGKEPLGA